jgi:error-prone DNA polymerase
MLLLRTEKRPDGDACADMGIVKIDLLGLGMMTVLKDCLGLIKDHWREEIDLGKLPEDDTLVYQTLQKSDTIGMFQVESRAQMATLPRLKPKNFYDGSVARFEGRTGIRARWSVDTLRRRGQRVG